MISGDGGNNWNNPKYQKAISGDGDNNWNNQKYQKTISGDGGNVGGCWE